MEKEKNSEVLNTTPKNNVDSTADSFISQKQIADKANNSISEFIILSKSDFTIQDWIFKPKFLAVGNGLSDTPLDYPLKRTVQGNVDEGKNPVNGKALRITVDKDVVSIAVYTQNYGQAWQLSHTHHMDKGVFDAYVLVVKNDQDILEREKKNKSPENFSLDLS